MLSVSGNNKKMKAAQSVSRFSVAPQIRLNTCCQNISSLQVRHSATIVNSKIQLLAPVLLKVRHLGLGPTSKDFEETPHITSPLTKVHADELVLHLNAEERKILFNALQEFESNRVKENFEGE